MLKIGIEHEFVFKDSSDNFLDFSNSTYTDFQKVVEEFPINPKDKGILECKSLETEPKLCYVEGFEKFDNSGKLLETIPKGLEIRTPPFEDINKLIENFVISYENMINITSSLGLSPLLISFNPIKNFQDVYDALKSQNSNGRNEKELEIAKNSMLLYAFHINISQNGNSDLNDTLKKLNYYLPYIIPFSFSSPFRDGNLFEGLCYRIYELMKYRPLISIRKRIDTEVIEFRGFDVIGDTNLLRSILFLFKFLVEDNNLTQRAESIDMNLTEKSCLEGFENAQIGAGILSLLDSFRVSHPTSSDQLDYLRNIVITNKSTSSMLKEEFNTCGNIIQTISDKYKFN